MSQAFKAKIVFITIFILLLSFIQYFEPADAEPSGESFTYLPIVSKPSPISSGPYWAMTYGGIEYDEANGITATSDGGIVVVGISASFGFDYHAWMLKLSDQGSIVWQRGVGNGALSHVEETVDGGLIVAGQTGSGDAWLFRLDSAGNVVWDKTYGGSFPNSFGVVQEISDGNFIVAGSTESVSSDNDAWVVKLNPSGDIIWQKIYQGEFYEGISSIQETNDGGFIAVGTKYSTDKTGADAADGWILKLNGAGSIIWQKVYGGSDQDEFSGVQELSSGEYVVSGLSQSFTSNYDAWVLKLSADGSIIWHKAYDGYGFDIFTDILETADNGFLMAGASTASGFGNTSLWLVKINQDGSIAWQKAYGGDNFDVGGDLDATADGGYVVSGYADSYSAGDSDFWVMKIDADGSLNGCVASVNATAIVKDIEIMPQKSNATEQMSLISPVNRNSLSLPTAVQPNAVCGAK